MSCAAHPQIMSPCADDAVSVDQVLGTRGDVSFDEYGSLALTIGQTEVAVSFTYQKESDDYRFEHLYVKDEDNNPVDVRAVPKSQTTLGFECALTGTPITGNCTLYWRVVIPDPLHTCQTAAGGPKYAIVAPSQSGIQAWVLDEDFIEVTFPIEQPDNTWQFEALSVEAVGVATPKCFSMPTVIERSSGGFKLLFSGTPDELGYSLHWRIA